MNRLSFPVLGFWLLAALCVMMPRSAFAQLATKPAHKGFITNSNTTPKAIYQSAEDACTAEAPEAMKAYNYTNVDVIQCSSGAATSTYVSSMTYTNVVSDQYGGLHCGANYTTTRTVEGSPNCGVPLGSTVTQNNSMVLSIGEIRMCDAAEGWSQSGQDSCYRPDAQYMPAKDCPACGNPTFIGNGAKQETLRLGYLHAGSRPIAIQLRYSNQFHLAGGVLLGEPSWYLDPVERRLTVGAGNSALPSRVAISRGHSITEVFVRKTDGTYRSFDPQLLLQQVSGAWRRVDFRESSMEEYDVSGRLTSLRYFDGGGFDLAYDPATQRPATLTSVTGQQVQFAYADGRLASLALPDGSAILLSYQHYIDPIRHIADTYLKSVAYPDGKSVSFDYEPAISLPPPPVTPLNVFAVSSVGKQLWSVPVGTPGDGPFVSIRASDRGRASFNLSGVVDEMGVLFASFQYDATGRVILSKHAGDTYRYSFGYTSGQVQVVDPLQARTAFYLAQKNEQLRVTARVSNATSMPTYYRSISTIYDSSGNVIQTSDSANSTVRCFEIDAGVNRDVARLEGAYSCPSSVAAHQPTGVERKISSQWHPDWRVVTRTAEPSRITMNVYNGQPDPFNGNAIASCAPPSALLPDGKPIAVLCKRVEQATTDANGALGFTAALQPGVPARTTTWTYNQWGQVLTENGPRTDVNDTTTYTYYSDTSFTGEGAAAVGHFVGDLATVTNAAGKVTQYTKYNKHGQVLESVDPNGVLTTNTYDLRQRLLSTTVGGQTTSYQYDPVGQLKRVTLPDQSWIGYDYDDAHRQVAVYDHKGNRVDYQLDNAGNRIGEQTKDPGGALKRQLSRSIDALGRVQQTTGRE